MVVVVAAAVAAVEEAAADVKSMVAQYAQKMIQLSKISPVQKREKPEN